MKEALWFGRWNPIPLYPVVNDGATIELASVWIIL